MKQLLGLCALVFVAFAGWHIGGRLSSDAIALALGVLFGVIAGIPASLMVLAARRHEEPSEPPRQRYREMPQPPVIVVTGMTPRWAAREWTFSEGCQKLLDGPRRDTRR